MSDSVGKISLDVELQGDLSKQINESAAKIGEQLKASLQNIGNFNFEKITGSLSDTLKIAMDKALSGINISVENVFNNAGDTISEVINMSKENALAAIAEINKAAAKMLEGVAAMSKKIKIPVSFPNPTNTSVPNTEGFINPTIPRGPPMPSIPVPKIPKINTGINLEILKSQIDNLSQSLDITNSKIEQQREKLAGLKESYAMAFDGARKNKLQEEILKTESAINKLIATSDNAGFKLADLDAQFAVLGNMAKDATSGVNAVDNKLKQTANSATKTSGSLKGLGNSAKNTGNSFSNSHNSMSMFFGTMVRWGIIFPMIIKGITAIGTNLLNSLKVNEQFSNSLNLIKSNLYTAFMPIYQAILPAINTLMSALATATAYIASFIGNIFGKTYQQSFNAAKAMQSQVGALTQTEKQAKKTATSLTGVGNAATAAGNAAKKASGGLAGFDEINKLGGSNEKGSGTPGSGVITPITPMTNIAPIEATTSKWADGFKKVLSSIFQPFKKAWAAVGPSVTAEFNKAIEGSKVTISNFFKMLATPPVQQFLENIGILVLSIIKLGLRIYDGFILPILNWFIHILPGAASGLNPVVNMVTGFVNFLSGTGFPVIQTILGLMIAWKAATIAMTIAQEAQNAVLAIQAIRAIGVSGALGLFEGVTGSATVAQWLLSAATGASIVAQTAHTIAVGAWNIIATIATGVTMAFGAAIAFLTSPITLTILAIGALIAIGLLLYKNWDIIKAKASEVWIGIQNIFATFSNWLGSVFTTDWSNKFGFLGNILNAYLANVRNIFNSVKQIFSGIIDFVSGVFTGNWSKAWNGVKNVFSGIVNTFGAVMKAPLNGIIGLINGTIGGLNKIKVPGWVPGLGGSGIDIPKIPYLARGGVINQPTLAMVGERGQEAVMPLENNTGWINNLAGQISAQIDSNNTGTGNREIIDILKQILKTLSGQSGDLIIKIGESEFARIAINAINKRTRMTGKTELII
ncbi:hypothetical protein [Candidatus Clostridium stratigraminis]|uniref:Phage-related protein n=1 Tax=Candidatus Clostridium stratigraminis TaxID=3381661 RepID=A0ABW8SZ16_9CLOT